jgi:hypothetical protein
MPYGIPCRRGSPPSALRRQCIGSQLVEALAALTIELHNRAISDAIRCARTRDIQRLYPRHAARRITLGYRRTKLCTCLTRRTTARDRVARSGRSARVHRPSLRSVPCVGAPIPTCAHICMKRLCHAPTYA